MATIAISLFGEFRLVIAGATITIPSKGQELLAFLAINPYPPTSRERLAGLLWPDFPQDRALANLSTTLWRIRVAVGDSAPDLIIRNSDGAIVLNRVIVSVDLWDFEAYTSRLLNGETDVALARKVISIYRGEMLEVRSDAAWLLIERERTRKSFIQVLQIHGDSELRAGRFQEATRAYEVALEADPLNEEVCRALMTLFAALGKTSDSLRVFVAFRRRLRAELGLDPEVETLKLLDGIRGQSLREKEVSTPGVAPTGRSMTELRIVGRERELLELDGLLSEAVAGRAQWIGVEGEIGVGKTRLILEFCRSASLRGCKVVYDRCPEFPRPSPYSVLKEILTKFVGVWPGIEALVNDKVEGQPILVQPESFPPGPSMESRVMIKCAELVAAKLQEDASQSPVVMILEDVQFSDNVSLGLIMHLQSLMRNQRFLAALTWRAGEAPSIWTASQWEMQRIIALSRLSRPAIEVLCHDHLAVSPVPKPVVDFVFLQSEGNPLFAVECLRALRTKSGPHQPKDLVRGASRRFLPAVGDGHSEANNGIRAYVVKRLRPLSRDVARLLEAAAACGREIEPEFMAKVLKARVERVLHLLGKLVRTGFVIQGSGRFEFSHDKIRQLCYEEIPPSRWVRLHSRVHEVLRIHFPDRLEALAFHSGRAGLSQLAAGYWERIGDRALSLWAHSDAVTAYDAAIESLERAGIGREGRDQKFQLLQKRCLALEQVGELERGSSDIKLMQQIARDAGDDRRSCEALSLESRFLLKQGAFSQSLERARMATQVAHSLGLSALEAQSREVAALSMYRLGDHVRAEDELQSLRKMLEDNKDVDGLERVWSNLGRVQVVQGRHLQALDSLERAERCGTGNLPQRAMRSLFRGIAHGYLARGDEAILDLRLAAGDFARVGSSSGSAVANAYLAFYSLAKGDMVSGILCGRKGLPFKAGRTDARWAWNSASILSYGVWLVLGNYARALKEIGKFSGGSLAKGNTGLFLDTAAAIALEQGELDLALSLAKEAVDRLTGEAGPALADALLTLGRCYLTRQKPHEAVAVLSQATRICRETSEKLNLPRMMSFLAVAEKDIGLVEMAISRSRKAFEMLSENGEFAYIPQDVYWNHFLILDAAGNADALRVLHKAYRLVMDRASQLGRGGKSRFLRIPVNKQIVETWTKVVGKGKPFHASDVKAEDNGRADWFRVTAVIPGINAPWGKRLRSSDFVEVIWTIDAGKHDHKIQVLRGGNGLRRARILRLCAEANVQGGSPRERDLARVLGVTARTIRSDIAFLRTQGSVVQTRSTQH